MSNKKLTEFITNRDRVIIISKIIISIAVLIYLVNYIGTKKVISTLISADWFYLAAAIILLPLNLFIQYKKWITITSACFEEKSKGRAFRSIFFGISAGLFTPARIGEYLGRAIPYKISVLDISLATAIDKVFNVFFIFFAGAIAALYFVTYLLSELSNDLNLLIYSLFILSIAAFSVITWLLLSEDIWNNLFIKKIKNLKILSKIKSKLIFIKNLDRSSLIKIYFYSFFYYLLYISQYALLAAAFLKNGISINLFLAGVLMIFVKSIIPFSSFGEIGIREAASMYFISSFGLNETAGFNAAIVLFTLNLLIPSIFGLILFVIKERNK